MSLDIENDRPFGFPAVVDDYGMVHEITHEEFSFIMTALERYAEVETARYTDDNKADGRPFKTWWRAQQRRTKRINNLIAFLQTGMRPKEED